MNHSATKRLVLTGFFLALGLLMPFLTLQIPSVGSRLLPMHIPVLLGGFVLGGPLGLVIGFVTPLLRSIIFGLPPQFPTAFIMSFELATYGLLAGVVYRLLSKDVLSVYASLIIAMIGGRVVWGAVSFFVHGLSGTVFSWKMFTAGAVVNALPGIILQIVIIPVIVLALRRARHID